MIVITYMGQGMRRDTALKIAKLTKHQFYYQPKGQKPSGHPVSNYTLKGTEQIPNQEVVSLIRSVQSVEDTDYGYRKMYYHLMQCGFNINHKKVYRLMKQANLLKEKIKADQTKTYVRYRIVSPERPLHVLEMDIKMVWVTEHRRHAYILTIIDTFTRVTLHWRVGYQMKKEEVQLAWQQVIEDHLQPADLLNGELHVELRNDNGPQFSAKEVKAFLNENHIKQVFTHPYTPQENGRIESFHYILKKALGVQPFWSLLELESRLKQFYENYNRIRIHASIANLSPYSFWACWELNLIERTVTSKKQVRFKLTIPYQTLSTHESLREVLCENFLPFNRVKNSNEQTQQHAA